LIESRSSLPPDMIKLRRTCRSSSATRGPVSSQGQVDADAPPMPDPALRSFRV